MLVAGTIFPRGGPSANDLDHLALSRMLCPVCAVAYDARFTAARYFAEYDNDSASRYAPPSPTPVYVIMRLAHRTQGREICACGFVPCRNRCREICVCGFVPYKHPVELTNEVWDHELSHAQTTAVSRALFGNTSKLGRI